jgi:hypothetical protein
MKKRQASSTRFVVCIRNEGYPEAIELRKLYRVLPDAQAARVEHIRIIDESGEDYLYPKEFFASVRMSEPIKKVLAAV